MGKRLPARIRGFMGPHLRSPQFFRGRRFPARGGGRKTTWSGFASIARKYHKPRRLWYFRAESVPGQQNDLLQIRFLSHIKRDPVATRNVTAAGKNYQPDFWIASVEI